MYAEKTNFKKRKVVNRKTFTLVNSVFGSGFIESGSGFNVLGLIEYQSRSRVLMNRN
jgi:hypothetical protein